MKSVNQTYANEILLLSIVFFTGFISFSYLSYSNVLVGDDWNALVQPNFLDKTTVQMGRWMHKVISDLTFDRLFAPVFTLSFLLFVNSVGVVLFTKWISIKSLQERLIFSVLYVNNPIWIEAYLFKMGHLPKAFALIFCLLSAYIAINHIFIRKKYSIFLIISSAFFLAFGAACYQTYAFIAALIILLALFRSVLNKDKLLFWKVRITGIISVLSVIIYVAITYAVLRYFALPVKKNLGDRYNITDISGIENFGPNSLLVINKIFNFYIKGSHLLPSWITIISLAGFFIIIYRLYSSRIELKGKMFGILLLVSIFLLPWCISFINANLNMRYNMMIPLALTMSYFIYEFFLALKRIIYLKYLAIALLSGILFFMMFFNNAAGYAKYLSVQRDSNLTNLLINHILDNPEFDPNFEYKLAFIGKNPYKLQNQKRRPFDVLHNEYEGNLINMVNCGIWDCQLRRITDHIFLQTSLDNITYVSRSNRGVKKIIQKLNTPKTVSWPHKESVIVDFENKIICVLF